MDFLFTILLGYCIGSINFAVLVSKYYGINILEVGSKNPGATNVKRSVGRGPGNFVFVLDFLKGALAAYLPLLLFKTSSLLPFLSILGLGAAILGHSFSIFIRFKGGKGVATTMGGLLVIMPVNLIIGLAVWGISFYFSRYVSIASILFGVSLPFSAYFLDQPLILQVFAILLMLVILIRHRTNIQRLLKGEEARFNKK